jgi:hypothetical protein
VKSSKVMGNTSNFGSVPEKQPRISTGHRSLFLLPWKRLDGFVDDAVRHFAIHQLDGGTQRSHARHDGNGWPHESRDDETHTRISRSAQQQAVELLDKAPENRVCGGSCGETGKPPNRRLLSR